MSDQDIRNAPKYAMKNRKSVEESGTCGCYYCCSVFPSVDISEWTDKSQTALCPVCKVDAVIAESQGVSLDEETLKVIHKHWFSEKK